MKRLLKKTAKNVVRVFSLLALAIIVLGSNVVGKFTDGHGKTDAPKDGDRLYSDFSFVNTAHADDPSGGPSPISDPCPTGPAPSSC